MWDLGEALIFQDPLTLSGARMVRNAPCLWPTYGYNVHEVLLYVGLRVLGLVAPMRGQPLSGHC